MTVHWTNHQVRDLRAFFAQGIRDKDLAEKLGRSVRAIREQRSMLGLLHKRGGPRRPNPAPAKVVITISRDALPAYYELGWRVSWFEAGQVGIEWPHADAVRVPA